jgi:hypothetical protein
MPDEVVQAVLRGVHRRLPDIALVEFPVAHHHVHPAVEVVVEVAEDLRHAGALRQALAERPTRALDPGEADPLGMALQAEPSRRRVFSSSTGK